MKNTPKINILIVEDEPDYLYFIKKALDHKKYQMRNLPGVPNPINYDKSRPYEICSGDDQYSFLPDSSLFRR